MRVYSNDFKKMTWDEFCSLLSGLGAETALGRTVQIRIENDKEILKHYTPSQHRIRNEWQSRKAAKVSEQDMGEILDQLKNTLIAMAGDNH